MRNSILVQGCEKLSLIEDCSKTYLVGISYCWDSDKCFFFITVSHPQSFCFTLKVIFRGKHIALLATITINHYLSLGRPMASISFHQDFLYTFLAGSSCLDLLHNSIRTHFLLRQREAHYRGREQDSALLHYCAKQ